MMSVLLQQMAEVIPTENSAFSVLLWGVSIIIPAMSYSIIRLYLDGKKKQAAHESKLLELKIDHTKELKEERDYIKQEGKDNAKILHGLSSVLSDLSRGIEKDLPKDILQVKETIDTKVDEIKKHIDLRTSGT